MHETYKYSYESNIFIGLDCGNRLFAARRDSKVSRNNKKSTPSVETKKVNKNFIVISDNLTKHFHRLLNKKKYVSSTDTLLVLST